MGIYDRDYNRASDDDDRRPGYYLAASFTMVTKLIIVTAVIYCLQLATNGYQGWLTRDFSLTSDWFRQPWKAYQLLTYGFLHDPGDLKHIVFNMLGLYFLGRDVEFRYGSREFLAYYLVAIVFSGLVWSLVAIPDRQFATILGASGGIAAVVILFALNFPHRTVLFMFFLPMPMWVFALILVGYDISGAMGRPGAGNVAFTAHLAGAAFALIYYYWGLRLERLLPPLGWRPRLRPRPPLRVHQPEAESGENTESRVDEILRKIQEHGQDSLTRAERQILQQASQEYQKRRH